MCDKPLYTHRVIFCDKNVVNNHGNDLYEENQRFFM